MTGPVYWIGHLPDRGCEICYSQFEGKMVDGKIRGGPWALMCRGCHEKYGHGLGVGRGQLYEKQPDGRWMKTEG